MEHKCDVEIIMDERGNGRAEEYGRRKTHTNDFGHENELTDNLDNDFVGCEFAVGVGDN